ncbi:16S rRNA (cytosine967-C5)-methyltransferase [Bacillus ectoiniformans]|uniref:16S rRNA (cytosine(967)-C(5))-methyltransferase RsmB n=1 Tax=Bacillus ectoiniformans TaxID=1494429 RepID=UPI00195D1E3A|nr:16S rRNA (cytosine(967)-C(5))-methyltransferase RsmB [Bacillus ectoiniformans]MBM7647180.1 16S rRNA (cytosine967-C5)-methyltransferase [Bacillus ectoiniformans]
MKQSKKSVRELALDLLEAVEKNQSYSNLLLNSAIEKNRLSSRDAGLLTELTYGTIQRKMTLDYYLAPFAKKKLESWVRQLLRLSLYQMVYLDKIPERAVIHEAVELAKKRGHKGISGLVNGILRSIQREGVPSLDEIKEPAERISIETSHPLWLVKRWIMQFGEERTKSMCQTNLMAPTQSIRVNTTKASREAVLELLKQEGYEAEPSDMVPEAIHILKGNIAQSDVFKTGLATIQDESSMLVAYALDVQTGQTVLDTCAAPGGKTTHIAEKLNNTGKVSALDLHEHKMKFIHENASRLGLANIETKALDSRKAGEIFEEESFDRILVDAPCSGLGVLRRKPDIKYVKKEEDLLSLQKVQLDILHAVSPLLTKGGSLVYSTCTVDKEENLGTVEKFLENHSDFELATLEGLPQSAAALTENGMLQVLPQDFGGDGFFICKFRKKVQ